MPDKKPYLFTESNFGALPPGAPTVPPAGRPRDTGRATPPPSFVESLGFPQGTHPGLLAQVIEDTLAVPPIARLDHLRSPGVLSRLFSQSAAEASYALAILAIVESPTCAATLARLKTLDSPPHPIAPPRP